MSVKNNLAVYIAGKLIRMVLLLAVLSVLVFILVSYSPIDPIQTYVGADRKSVV